MLATLFLNRGGQARQGASYQRLNQEDPNDPQIAPLAKRQQFAFQALPQWDTQARHESCCSSRRDLSIAACNGHLSSSKSKAICRTFKSMECSHYRELGKSWSTCTLIEWSYCDFPIRQPSKKTTESFTTRKRESRTPCSTERVGEGRESRESTRWKRKSTLRAASSNVLEARAGIVDMSQVQAINS